MPMLTFYLLLYCTINTRKYVLRLNSGNFFYLDLNYAKKSCSPNIFRKAAKHNFMKNSLYKLCAILRSAKMLTDHNSDMKKDY